jgi:hypothetical protein
MTGGFDAGHNEAAPGTQRHAACDASQADVGA